jgi:hypothetical protein
LHAKNKIDIHFLASRIYFSWTSRKVIGKMISVRCKLGFVLSTITIISWTPHINNQK